MTDENDRSKRLIKRQMKMTDGNDRSLCQKKCRYTIPPDQIDGVAQYPAVGEPISLIYPAAGEPVSLIYPAAGEPVSLISGSWRASIPHIPGSWRASIPHLPGTWSK